MKVYLLHKNKIFSYSLPSAVNGSYFLNDFISGEKVDLIKIEAVDNKWVAYSNDDIKIKVNDSIVDSVELKSYNFYKLILYGNEVIDIYICPLMENNYSLKMLPNDSTLLIGNSSKCDILYDICSEKQLKLTYSNGCYHFENLNKAIPIYINLYRRDSGFLKNFDTIFIMGLKIIVIGPYLYINNPTGKVNYIGNKFVKPVFSYLVADYKNEGRVYKDFYSDSDYFARSPVFHNKLGESTVEIADPPSVLKTKGNSVLMEVIPSAVMSISSLLSAYFAIQKRAKGEADDETFTLTMVMCVVFLFTGIFWPFIQHFYQKVTENISLFKSRKNYKKYLKKKKESINEMRLRTQATLKNIYLSINECAAVISKRTPYLYSVGLDSNRFLTIRLGIGSVPFDVKIEYKRPEFQQEENKLYNDIDKMLEETKNLIDVPVTLSLKESNVVAFVNKDEVCKYDYMRYILFQILTLHSFEDLKIVVFTQDEGASELSFVKKLNHCWDSSISNRFFATNLNQAADISTYLEGIFLSRSKTSNEGLNETNADNAYYLIVCDCISYYRDINIINDILNSKNNYGFSLAMFDEKLTDIPNKCNKFIEYSLKEGTYFESEMEENNIRKFKTEFFTSCSEYVDIYKYSSLLANIPMRIENNESKDLPTTLGFLEMYGVGNVNLLNCVMRWKQSDVVNTLAAPVGVDPSGNLVYLDLHEKRHGPHGLIAGMTGSGKSEFIVTYILSLAVNYSPDEVQFVLIDYKGGGLAGAFENRQTGIKLPHLVGTITNLDKSEMNRTLASIQSELQRRQRKFNEIKEKLNIGTIDIYKYQQLYREKKIDEPMSHLFIISDEFAELKSQQPDFMDKLVSAARIGRSLGIHLILATQKPSGVVDDQIWSNSKFKVCCKVQTADDSTEMLGKPDAAFLKDSGRFYLQVGYDIYYILGQSAYSGLKYIPSDKIATNIDNSILSINSVGENIKIIDNELDDKLSNNQVDLGEELSNVIKYIISSSKEINYINKQLWLDNIPNAIFIEQIKNKYKNSIKLEKGIIDTPIGEYDDPENQSQGLVTLPITLGGNCFISGISGSGKSTLLSTLILSTIISHTTDEVNFYIIDFANEKLKKFEKAPQVGNVLTMDNNDKVMILLNRIISEMKNRKKILSKVDMDYISYIKSNKKPILPNYIVIINGFDSFKEQYQDFIDENFMSIIRECNKYGITFIISTTDPGILYSSQMDQFPQRILLKFNDNEPYMDLFGTTLVPSDNPGRGIIKIGDNIFQFQTSLIVQENMLNETLKQIFERLSSFMTKAEQIPIMPEFVTIDNFTNLPLSLSNVPIGYNIDTIKPSFYNFDNQFNLIIGSKQKYILSFINQIAKLISKIPKTKVVILDGTKQAKITSSERIKYYDSDFAPLVKALYKNMIKYDEASGNKIVMFIFGYEIIQSHLVDYYKDEVDGSITLEKLMYDSKDSGFFKFIISGEYENPSKLENEKWYSFLSKKHGILIATAFDEQEFISAKRVSNEYDLNLDESNAIVVRNSMKEFITYISE